jgi:hypothetical protein
MSGYAKGMTISLGLAALLALFGVAASLLLG